VPREPWTSKPPSPTLLPMKLVKATVNPGYSRMQVVASGASYFEV
jgi:hypothetical protein